MHRQKAVRDSGELKNISWSSNDCDICMTECSAQHIPHFLSGTSDKLCYSYIFESNITTGHCGFICITTLRQPSSFFQDGKKMFFLCQLHKTRQVCQWLRDICDLFGFFSTNPRDHLGVHVRSHQQHYEEIRPQMVELARRRREHRSKE